MARKPLTDEQRVRANESARRYNAKPESIAARKAYYRLPEVRQRYLDRSATPAQRAYMAQWRQSEKGKSCLKDGSLRQRGFSLELWNTLLELQGNACALCRNPFSANPRHIHADHCHEAMLPRGLLCQQCNLAEGHIRKTGLHPAEFGRRLAAYLDAPPARRLTTAPKAHTSQKLLQE